MGDVYLGTHTRDGQLYRSDFPPEDRKRHTYVVGGTGSGKTELLKVLIHHEATVSRTGVVVVDAHTDVCEQIAQWPDPALQGRVMYLRPDLFSGMFPSINPLQVPKGADARTKDKIANGLGELIGDIARGSGGADLSVRMVSIGKAAARVLLDREGSNLRDLYEFLSDDPPAALLSAGRNHPDFIVQSFFRNEWDNGDYKASKAGIRARLMNSLLDRDFVYMTCSPSTFSFYDALDEGKILLFSLGGMGGPAAQTMGKMVISMVANIGEIRKGQGHESRTPVHVFVDECQNFMGPSVTNILTQLRKYGVHLTLANQYITTFSKDERDAVLSSTFVKMMGRTDAAGPMLAAMGTDEDDLENLKDRQFLVRWGAKSVRTVSIRSDLADDAHKMLQSEWLAFRMTQKQFYVSPDHPVHQPSRHSAETPQKTPDRLSRELD